MISNAQRRKNRQEAEEVLRLRAPVVYTAIKHEGEDELSRPTQSLWWSGLAAGVAIFLSVICMAALRHNLGEGAGESLIVHLGYCVGFLVVILGRLQLFTENTITAVVPLLADPTRKNLNKTLRLWLVVFAANMVGVFLVSVVTIYGEILEAGMINSIISIAEHYVSRDATHFLMQGIPAGFIVAALVWMLPSSEGFEFWVIMLLTYFISLGGMTHVIAGAGEVFIMMLLGHISVAEGIFSAILPTLIGNILGGTGLFALLAYGQVKGEI